MNSAPPDNYMASGNALVSKIKPIRQLQAYERNATPVHAKATDGNVQPILYGSE